MRIGVLSDTHLTAASDRRVLERIFDGPLAQVDLLLHAGDLVELEVFEPYIAERSLLAVAGNMDSDYTRRRLPQTRLLELAGYSVGLAHGWGAPEGIEQRLFGLFDRPLDLLIHGHTHEARFERCGATWVFNPGSAVLPRFTDAASVGIIELGERIEARVIALA